MSKDLNLIKIPVIFKEKSNQKQNYIEDLPGKVMLEMMKKWIIQL